MKFTATRSARLLGRAAIGQAVFYAFAAVGWMLAANGRKSLFFYFPFYFLMMNFCVFAGFFRYLSGSQQQTWKKAARS